MLVGNPPISAKIAPRKLEISDYMAVRPFRTGSNHPRSVMNHIEELAQATGKQKLELFSAKLADCERMQTEVLMDILAYGSECEFGKQHEFAKIANVESYKKCVPITHWEDFDGFAEKMQNGESDLLFPGVPICFIATSGTTGREKLIPESDLGKKAKTVIGDIRNAILLKEFPNLLKGKFLSLSNSSAIGVTKGGIPYGMASGMTLDGTPAAILALNACPQAVKKIENQAISDYAIMRFAVEQDVRVVTGNNPARLQTLIEIAENRFDSILADIENGTLDGIDEISANIANELRTHLKPNPARVAELKRLRDAEKRPLPSLYWPNLKIFRCWLSGSIGRYVERLAPLLNDKITLVDGGYGASEGKFNIPTPDGRSSGALANFAAFYEFVPETNESENNASKTKRTLLAHELEDGKEYRLVITTYSGLYRYDMRDIISVDGFTGTTPNIKFVSKTSDIGNICGEKLYPDIIAAAFQTTANTIGLRLNHFCAVPDVENLRYTFCLETNNKLDEKELERVSATLDSNIAKLAMGYEFLRGQHLLNPPVCVAMRHGWKKALVNARTKPGVSTSQIKLPVVCDAKKALIDNMRLFPN